MMTTIRPQAELERHLRPVRRRMRLVAMIRSALLAGILGGCISLLLGTLRGLGLLQGIRWELFLPPLSLLPGALAGASRPIPWRQVARAVDRRYQLKDRILTAWEFAVDGVRDPLVSLQHDDALRHMGDIHASQVASTRLPRTAWAAGLLWAMSLLLSFLAKGPESLAARQAASHPAANAVPSAQETIVDKLEQELMTELRQLAELTGTRPPDALALEQTMRDLTRQFEQLRRSPGDERQLLASLSEMQTTLEKARSQFAPEQIQAEFKQLAAALANADGLELLPELLAEEQMEQAAELLEQWQPDAVDPLQRTTVAEDLKTVEEELRTKDSPLADAVQSLQEGLESDDAEMVQAGAQQVSAQMQQAAQRIAIRAELDNQLAGLSEARGRARSGGNNTAPSDESRETWGHGQAGNPLGDTAQQLESSRNREQVQGVQGQGPSQRTLEATDQAEGTAERPYQAIDRTRGGSVEQVLSEESLPLGQRATIRRYFESLREADASE